MDASIQANAYGVYQIRLRIGSKQCKRSLQTKNRRQAEDRLGVVRETLRDLNRGLLTVPPNVDPLDFLLSGGKLKATPAKPAELVKPVSLKDAWERYRDSFPDGSKESLRTERIQFNHFCKFFGEKAALGLLTHADMQRYANARGKQKGLKGRSLSGETIKKELATFRLVWNHNLPIGQPCPVKDERGKPVKLPKTKAREPFRTLDEVTAIIERGVSPQREAELWESVFLSVAEIRELLEHVKKVSAGDFRYPMFAIAAFTGARRSEIMRAEIEHFRFESGWLQLTEKKRNQRSHTYRNVPIRGTLEGILRDWFKRHPGGQWAICKRAGKPISVKQADDAFRDTLAGTKWARLKGWHMFRHSFASNLASNPKNNQAVIDRLLGHQTAEMRERYRHLFPNELQRAVETIDSLLAG